MKKKLLLVALLVMAISCMLVFSASAEEMNPDYNKQYVKTMTQNMTSVELEDGTSVNLYDEQGYTLCYYWDDVSSANRKLLSVRTKDLTFNFSKTSLSSIYYGEEHLAGTAKAGRIVVLNLRGVKNGSNQDITNFSSDNMFKEDSPLQHIFMPDTIEELIGYAFGHRDGSLSHLRGCYFSENSKLKCIKSNTFMNARQLKGFYIPDGVTYVGTNGFQGCHNAFFVNDPYDFLTKPDVYYFPKLFYKAEGEAFDSLKYNLNYVLVFSADNIEITNAFAFEVVACDSKGTKPVIVFKGDVAAFSVGRNSGEDYCNAEMVIFANSNDKTVDDFTFVGKVTSKLVFCNAEGNTTHLVEAKATTSVAATCETNRFDTTFCFCGAKIDDNKEIADTKLGHDYTVLSSISYADYAKEGTKVHSCSRDNCVSTSESAVAAIIANFSGYSVPTNPQKAGITFRYEINRTALEEYNSINEDLKFGVVGVVEAFANGNKPLTNDCQINSAVTGNVIFADISESNTKVVDFVLLGSAEQWESKQVINGVETNLKDLAIIMAGYIYDGAGVHYIQSKGTMQELESVSYSQVNSAQ